MVVLVVADVVDTTTLVAMVVTVVATMLAIPIMVAIELVVVFLVARSSHSSRSRCTIMVATQEQCPEREAVDASIVVNWGTG